MKREVAIGVVTFFLGMAATPSATEAGKPATVEMWGLCARYEIMAAPEARRLRADGKLQAAKAIESMRDMFCWRVNQPPKPRMWPE